METHLSQRQQRALDFIREYIAEHGFAPSYDEIRQHIGVASLNAVRDLLDGLERKGYIRRLAGRSRALVLLGETNNSSPFHNPLPERRCETVPIISTAPVENNNPLSLFLRPRGLLSLDTDFFRLDGKAWFVAIAPDDTLADWGISHGDALVVEQTDQPTAGDITLCITDGKQLLRRLAKNSRKGHQELHAPNHPPLLLDRERVRVVGVVRWVIRRL